MSTVSDPTESLFVRTGESLPEAVQKVTFYPNVDDLAYAAQKINKSYKFPARAQHAMLAFLTLNMFGLPLVLWYFGQPFMAMGVLVLSALFAGLFVPALIRSDYSHYFTSMYGYLENELCEVELSGDGVSCRHKDDHSFFSWNSIKEIEETKTAIHFVMASSALTVPKTGFSYDEEKNRFLEFAKARVPRFNTA